MSRQGSRRWEELQRQWQGLLDPWVTPAGLVLELGVQPPDGPVGRGRGSGSLCGPVLWGVPGPSWGPAALATIFFSSQFPVLATFHFEEI